MNRYLFLLFLMLCSFSVNAQVEVVKDTIVESSELLKNAASSFNSQQQAIQESLYDQDSTLFTDSTYADADDEYQQYELRSASDSIYQLLKADPSLKYKKTVKDAAVNNKPQIEAETNWFFKFLDFLYDARNVLVIIATIGLVAILIWFLDKNKMLILRGAKKQEQVSIPESIESWGPAEYRIQISSSTQQGDLKMAVRWWYLYTLYNLNLKEFIIMGDGKTNNEYLRNMRPTPYYKKFASLTLDYEYIWYGGFTPDDTRFQHIRQSFSDFNQTIEGES
ncbi:hypothetical protein DVR12_16735 [Chitinophaga silvatica]|uniref:DUF4129 domain-containing protein n=1 Tax=Chitinophaga silvatica TaxID=2282649 RepID=A0A3E1Y7F1_9BACT|nr:hypothetical protein [Chitinophaga silvatica]RFS20995.1 hypothetical protein DVR12_16735 [Chitinophaga silvatica]